MSIIRISIVIDSLQHYLTPIELHIMRLQIDKVKRNHIVETVCYNKLSFN
jgi:hypothetical protein